MSNPLESSRALTLVAPAQIEFAAAAEGEKPKRPTFKINAYTGVPVNVGFYSPVIVDLTGLKATSQTMPILRDHDASQIVGQTSEVKIDAAGVTLSGTVTGDNAHAAEVVSQARNGFRWQASIGASIDRREFLEPGKTATVNGRSVSGPLIIAREATLKEVSFVAIGADSQTSASVAASSNSGKDLTMFDKWLQAKGIDPAAATPEVMTVLKAAYEAEKKASEAPKLVETPRVEAASRSSTLDEIFARQREEDERVAKITEITAQAMADRPALREDIKKFADTAIESKMGVDQFELSLLRLLRPTFPTGTAGRDRNRNRAGGRVIEAALAMSGGLKTLEKDFDEQTLNAAQETYPSGLGLRDLLVMAARENGYTGYSSTDIRALLKAAFEIRAGFSTLSLPGILSNTANKFLLQGFNAVEDGWRTISAIRPVRDFKTNTYYTLTGGMTYEQVAPDGKLKHGTVGEQSYTLAASTYGKMFAITRQDIYNDDLGALTEIPMKLGRGAALKLNSVFWTAFLATRDTFWASGHSNLSSGAGSALSSAGLTAAQLKFSKQTDPDGNPLGVMAKILLVPPELEITANELMTSLVVNTGGAATDTKVPNRNVWTNKYQVVVSTYLSNTAITNYSTAHWFLVADPMDLPTVQVAFLNGREQPVVESADADFDVLGIQMRGYHDFGVALAEYRASVRSAGS